MSNIFPGADPLLVQPQNQYQLDIDAQIAQLESVKQRMLQQKQAVVQQQGQPQQSKSPLWDEIDSEIDSMTERELNELGKSDEFQKSNNLVQSVLNREFVAIMRPIVESTKDGKEALQNHLAIVKKLKKTATEKVDKNLALFTEYTEKYSDKSWAEFLEMKKKEKKK